MYSLLERNDRAILLPHLPQPAGGPPLIVTSDIELRFAYPIATGSFHKNQPGWTSEEEPTDPFVEVVREGSFLAQGDTSEGYALWDTGICPGHILRQYSGQEDVRAHPLAERGLAPCGVFEVKPSAWLRHLQSTEPENLPAELTSRSAPATQMAPVKPLSYHHLLFAFRGTALEFITDRLSYELFQGAEQVRQEIHRIKWGADLF
jgi:hypothetical protein